MPRKLPPNLHRETTRHGTTVWYFRRGHGRRVRIIGEFDSAEFWAAFGKAAKGEAKPRRHEPAHGTFQWAVERYRQSQAWLALSPATRRQRENTFARINKSLSDSRLSQWKKGDIVAGRDTRAATPAAARHFVETLRGLFAWAFEAGHVRSNPCDGVKVATPKTEGFPVWSEDDIAAYRSKWPLGTRQRLAFEVLRETGLRRGDAAALSLAHIRDGVIRLMTEKTGERVAIRVSETLAEAIEAGPCGAVTIISGAAGKPYVKEAFGNEFREWCNAAGVVGKSAHGLRKAAATSDALDGWSDAELDAKFGWTGRRMASHYTRAASRERLSLAAAERTKRRTESPAPKPESAGIIDENPIISTPENDNGGRCRNRTCDPSRVKGMLYR